LTKTLTFFLM